MRLMKYRRVDYLYRETSISCIHDLACLTCQCHPISPASAVGPYYSSRAVNAASGIDRPASLVMSNPLQPLFSGIHYRRAHFSTALRKAMQTRQLLLRPQPKALEPFPSTSEGQSYIQFIPYPAGDSNAVGIAGGNFGLIRIRQCNNGIIAGQIS